VKDVRREYKRMLSLTILFVFALSFASIAKAQTTLVYIDPPENTANPGESFTVNINIEDVTALYSYGVKIGFNQFILEVTDVSEGPFLSSMVSTAFVYKLFSDYVDIGCTTLGTSDGVSGTGTLFTVTFNVKDAGTSDLDMFYCVLLDPTLTAITHETANGYFYSAAEANLVRRSAWPEHHHFVVSKDEDYDGTWANQTLNAKVKNLGTIDLYVYATFEIVRDDGFVATVNTEVVLCPADTIVELSGDFTVNGTHAGKYAVSTKAMYSWTGSYFTQGEKTKSFSFAVVP
jgi:hypothetical protein